MRKQILLMIIGIFLGMVGKKQFRFLIASTKMMARVKEKCLEESFYIKE